MYPSRVDAKGGCSVPIDTLLENQCSFRCERGVGSGERWELPRGCAGSRPNPNPNWLELARGFAGSRPNPNTNWSELPRGFAGSRLCSAPATRAPNKTWQAHWAGSPEHRRWLYLWDARDANALSHIVCRYTRCYKTIGSSHSGSITTTVSGVQSPSFSVSAPEVPPEGTATPLTVIVAAGFDAVGVSVTESWVFGTYLVIQRRQTRGSISPVPAWAVRHTVRNAHTHDAGAIPTCCRR